MAYAEDAEFVDGFRSRGALAARIENSKTVPKEWRLAFAARAQKILERNDFNPDAVRFEMERDFTETANTQRVLGEALGQLNPKALRAFLEVLLPRFAKVAEASLRAMARRTYQTDSARRPFRCPGAADQLNRMRAKWLFEIALALGDLEVDIAWCAAYGQKVTYGMDHEMAWFMAGALELGGESARAVLEVFTAIAASELEGGEMSHMLVRASLCAECEPAWSLIERVLLAAQRQEGLRQTILESIDEAHPAAFLRMLRLIVEHKLARFSSVVRAVDVWFGFLWDGTTKWKIDEVILRAIDALEHEDNRAAALEGGDPEAIYLALWATACGDVERAIELARPLVGHSIREHRFVAVHLLAQTNWTTAQEPLVAALDDPDLRVVSRALESTGASRDDALAEPLFSACERLLARLVKKTTPIPWAVWPWTATEIKRADVALEMFHLLTPERLGRFLPFASELDPWQRADAVRWMSGASPMWVKPEVPPRRLEGPVYEVVLDFLGDPSPVVRKAALDSLGRTPVLKEEVERHVDLLRRKSSDARTNALARIWQLPDEALNEVATQLMEDKLAPRRLAGLELARKAFEGGRAVDGMSGAVDAYRSKRRTLTEEEEAHLAVFHAERKAELTLDDALGLIDREDVPTWPTPAPRPIEPMTAAALASLESLAQLILEHKDVEVENIGFDGSSSQGLFLTARHPALGARVGGAAKSMEELEPTLPLLEVWKDWHAARPASMIDGDELELARLYTGILGFEGQVGPHAAELLVADRWDRSAGRDRLRELLVWLIRWSRPRALLEFGVDRLENAAARFTEEQLQLLRENPAIYSSAVSNAHAQARRNADSFAEAVATLDCFQSAVSAKLDGDLARRVYGLLRWFHRESWSYEWSLGIHRFLAAYESGVFASEKAASVEFTDLLLGPLATRDRRGFMADTSRRDGRELLAVHPSLQAVRASVLERALEVEFLRGDLPTPATPLLARLDDTGGLATLRRAIDALGRTDFVRVSSWSSDGNSRAYILSRLAQNSEPRAGDSVEDFQAWVVESQVPEAKLVALAAYAPQWAGYVEATLGWPRLKDAVLWIHAHTRDNNSGTYELRGQWNSDIAERTPLSFTDLLEGAVDVDWFQQVYAALGKSRWAGLFQAAKYASSGGGHTRAQLFASAMLGEIKTTDLQSRIDTKRHQDSVRALGLVPLRGGKLRPADLLKRYEALAAFRSGSRKFGSQRQASERRAVAIGMENLARTAGFRDPLRLTWAMEREAVRDLIAGPVTIARGDVSVTLSVDDEGRPRVAVVRADKALKSVPKSHAKDPGFVVLLERGKDLAKQARRVRDVLESSMIRGDVFDGAELVELSQHPILGPAFVRVVFVGEMGAGYLRALDSDAAGLTLVDAHGELTTIEPTAELRIAHPADLFERGDWHAWQAECFAASRVQPLKQVFRELYPLTEGERADGKVSSRYAGHQVNPRQALALLGGRQWLARPEEGVNRTFHELNLVARLEFQETFHTPADVEGLTLEHVIFTEKGKYVALDLASIPTRIFSEVMRDLDFVVSVAHQGGVDPESTASTIEMRAALLRETCRLLRLDNVEIKDQNALIEGSRAKYSVHLGSAQARVRGSIALAIVAVHSQRRGRLFLPFADDDPRTAEVLSKVLLLARDKELKDPNVLAQLGSA